MSKKKDINPSLLVFWFVVRCREKIRQRFRLGRKHWRERPWVTMVHWKPNTDDTFTNAQIHLPKLTVKVLCTRKRLLPTTTKDGSIAFNAETVQRWINCLGTLFTDASKLVRKTKLTDLAKLAMLMIYINDILEQAPIQELFHITVSLSEVVFTSTCSHRTHPCSTPSLLFFCRSEQAF